MAGQDFGHEVMRKMTQDRDRCPWTPDDVMGLLRAAVRDSIREELGDALSPIREDIRDIQANQSERDKHCSSEGQKTANLEASVKKLWDRHDAGDQCKACKNQDRITILETIISAQTKLGWILITAVVGLIVRAGWEAMLRGQEVAHAIPHVVK